MGYYNVTFKYSDTTYCSNIAMANSVEAVREHYIMYDDVSVSEASEFDVKDAWRKGKPFIACD